MNKFGTNEPESGTHFEEVKLMEGDGNGRGFDENLLQWIWAYQYLRRENLVTVDGQEVEIMHPGFWNRGPGPDFLRGVVRVGDGEAITGDIEVEISLGCWFAHGHDQSFHFAHVCLLVVWDARHSVEELRQRGISCPVVAIMSHLSESFEKMKLWYSGTPELEPTHFRHGKCQSGFRALDPGTTREILVSAGLKRIQARSRNFQAWYAEWGSEKALMLGLFTSLGQPSNAWPMRYLAEKVFELIPVPVGSWMEAQAILFGLAGWVPGQSGMPGSRIAQFLCELWEVWWRIRSSVEDCQIPGRVWDLGQVRPLNHPERRLALAAYWLTRDRLDDRLQTWMNSTSDMNANQMIQSLFVCLQPPSSPFWDHYHFLSSPTEIDKPTRLLGRSQLIDLAINAIFPWMLALSHRESDDTGIRFDKQKVSAVMKCFPGAAENARTRHMRERLFGSVDGGPRGNFLIQQGLLQIEVEFCRTTNSLCDQCLMPTHVKGFLNH